MTYHRTIDKLLCHYCGLALRPPARCPDCNSEYIHYVGEGTERLEADLKRFSVPLLIIVGDEDDTCLEGSMFLKLTVPTAGLLVVPRSGHNITSEEPAAFNAALADLFAAAEAGRWMAHRPPV